MADNAVVGRKGEHLAAGHLERLGYRIRERNFRCPLGEVDIIATQGEYLVFVEVKTRSADTSYHPTLAMTPAKKNRLRRLGEYYLLHHVDTPLQPRFDVVAVVLETAGQRDEGPRIEHLVNAF